MSNDNLKPMESVYFKVGALPGRIISHKFLPPKEFTHMESKTKMSAIEFCFWLHGIMEMVPEGSYVLAGKKLELVRKKLTEVVGHDELEVIKPCPVDGT